MSKDSFDRLKQMVKSDVGFPSKYVQPDVSELRGGRRANVTCTEAILMYAEKTMNGYV